MSAIKGLADKYRREQARVVRDKGSRGQIWKKQARDVRDKGTRGQFRTIRQEFVRKNCWGTNQFNEAFLCFKTECQNLFYYDIYIH